ncbi:hypothetical protein [Engelhardtia mirabilis]|uniref:Uncharacterized protein n=1 Tax=Engelhardtia mirabilis TaxID=2528011 RepID=A0A518BFI1_9BACT|nr:hypothetical protein Pla133_07380 [Planctomycetes bacterium Pla133]QDU99998.1 hypothetical protein Pla86_07370 [Planctomycetes bacterium Pla86]
MASARRIAAAAALLLSVASCASEPRGVRELRLDSAEAVPRTTHGAGGAIGESWRVEVDARRPVALPEVVAGFVQNKTRLEFDLHPATNGSAAHEVRATGPHGRAVVARIERTPDGSLRLEVMAALFGEGALHAPDLADPAPLIVGSALILELVDREPARLHVLGLGVPGRRDPERSSLAFSRLVVPLAGVDQGLLATLEPLRRAPLLDPASLWRPLDDSAPDAQLREATGSIGESDLRVRWHHLTSGPSCVPSGPWTVHSDDVAVSGGMYWCGGHLGLREAPIGSRGSRIVTIFDAPGEPVASWTEVRPHEILRFDDWERDLHFSRDSSRGLFALDD